MNVYLWQVSGCTEEDEQCAQKDGHARPAVSHSLPHCNPRSAACVDILVMQV